MAINDGTDEGTKVPFNEGTKVPSSSLLAYKKYKNT